MARDAIETEVNLAVYMERLDSYIDKIVYNKPNAKYYIDDKAIKFDNWNDMILKFIEE